jgi:hypothetical protein
MIYGVYIRSKRDKKGRELPVLSNGGVVQGSFAVRVSFVNINFAKKEIPGFLVPSLLQRPNVLSRRRSALTGGQSGHDNREYY